MTAELFGVDSTLLLLLVLVSLGLTVWAIVDVARRPSEVLSPGAKAAWIIGLLAGTILFGVIGIVVALVYLVGVRPRLDRTT